MYKLDHVGIAVENLENSIKEYQKNFGFSLELRETLQEQGVALAFLKLANTSLELLSPINERSTLSKFLTSRGPGLHHICYEVPDLKQELSRLKGLGLKLIDEQPRKGARNTVIAFLHPKGVGGVLTELCQYDKNQ